LNNMGNVFFLKNDLDNALRNYQSAEQERPDLAVPKYNLSVTYVRMLDLEKGKRYHREAVRLDEAAVQGWINSAKGQNPKGVVQANNVVIDLPFPRSWVIEHISKPEDADSAQGRREVAKRLWQGFGGIGTPQRFPFIGAGIALVFGGIFLLRRKMYLSTACYRCGRPVCRRCNTELRDSSVCGQCFHAFGQQEQVDAKSRIAKEIQIRRYRSRKESIARSVNFILPGVGQMLKERTFRGILFLSALCIILVQLWMGDGIVRSPVALGVGIDWALTIPLIIMALFFYVWSVLDVFRVSR